jgi:hypothetical protein
MQPCRACSTGVLLVDVRHSRVLSHSKPHFKQLFKAKGNYDEGFGKEQHKKKWVGAGGATDRCACLC